MALTYITKQGYPELSAEFNSQNQTYVSVYADDINRQLVFIDEKTATELYRIPDTTADAVIVLGEGTGSSYRCGNNNNSSGIGSTISGGCFNSTSGYYSAIVGGRNNSVSGYYSTASGYNNSVSGYYSSAFGCGLNASANCTLYANNFCACGTYATCSIPTSCAVCIGGVGGDKLVGYTATNYPRDYGSFYDITDQQTLGNVEELMEYGNTDLSNGVSIVNNGLGNPTQITVSNTGVYNIQFSAQLTKGGGPAGDVYFYLKKNGNPVPETNTQVTLANNNVFLVAAWNFFLQLNAGEYAEIAWYSTSATITLEHITAPLGLPNIPSVILTVSQL